ncbi:ATP binding [Coemansia guatemalensis]|uniref:ATP binding n=1 Tax=Coemansia guatemalensis TaxID=2761395 RepID=A0A9W8LTR0_9FUNG|nr:ATP binding [Coemansia guatemalensis]
MESPTAQHFGRLSTVVDEEWKGDEDAAMRYTMQQVQQWSEERVCQWVREEGFGKYEEAFRENQVNGEALVELNYNLLKELSVRTVGERVRLNLAIRRLRQQCLQTDMNSEAYQKGGKHGATGYFSSGNGYGAQEQEEFVASPVPMSAMSNDTAMPTGSISMVPFDTPSTAAGTGTLVSTSNGGKRKNLPILPRNSLSSNSIGLGDLGEHEVGSSSGSSANHSGRNNGNLLQRANTDTRAFGGRELKRQDQAHGLASSSIRKPMAVHTSSSSKGAQLSIAASIAQGSGEAGGTLQPQVAISHMAGTSGSGTAHVSEPMSAPIQRLRPLASSHRSQRQQHKQQADTASPSKKGAAAHGEDNIERLGFQLQEFFGTDISVAHLADSLSVRTWQIAVTGPENQVRHVSIANTSSAKGILDRVRRAFDLNNDVDSDQYSLFSMTSEGGGARCLSNEELARMFSDPDSTPPEKFFLRKRHQLTRPPMGSKRSEHLQRAIERLGNIIPVPPSSGASQPPTQRSLSKWESTTEKLTKILGERPPSELVSMNVEKYFPGNEARARHSIMRRRKNESQDSGADAPDNVARYSRRQSRAPGRRSTSSTRAMQARIRSLTLGSEDRWNGFSSSLEPIKESLAAPPPRSYTATKPVPPDAGSSSDAMRPATGGELAARPATADSAQSASKQLAAASEATSKQEKRMSKLYVSSPPPLSPSGSCASVPFSDEDDVRSRSDDDHNMGTLSDLSSELSDSFDSDDSSFYEGLSDGDIDADEDLAEYDSDQRASMGPDRKEAPEGEAKEGEAAAAADERRASVARSTSTSSRPTRNSHEKKKTWIKGAPIASGSFGSVYFGMNTRTGAIMAVKEVDLPKPGTVSMARNQRMADALRHELDLLKGLDHKNVVKYLGTDMDESNLYIFLEYVSGGSVSSALASFGMFPESLVRTYTGQIIEGLVYLHEQGIIHRDIKGGNVLIDQDGSVKISDFGISKRVDEVVVAAAASTAGRRASLQGSVFWMAPEVVKDTQYTVKGDVWSLGCLVIEMMTGAHPFPDLDQMQALYTIGQRGRPRIPSDISDAGQDFLDKTLQLDLDLRPTAKELADHGFVRADAVDDDHPSSP